MELDLTFDLGSLLKTLPMAGFGMLGIFIVVLVMMASVYGVTILSAKITNRKKKK